MGDNFKENVNALQDMILDEEKLITYVSLSKDLCIHINESKILLRQAVHDIRYKRPNIDLNVNFVISGVTDNNIARTSVCTETQLDALKKDFTTIFFEHIYSVCKGCPRVDGASLLATNKYEDLILCTGVIKSNICVKRTADEIGILKSNSQESVAFVEKNSNCPQKKVKKEVAENVLNELDKIKIEPKHSEIKPVKTIIEPGRNKIEVRHSETKPVKNVKTEVCSPKKDVISKQKVNKSSIRQKGIAGFLSKSNGVTSKEENMKKITNHGEEKSIKTEVKVEEMSVDEEEEAVKENDKNVIDKQEIIKETKNGNVMNDMKSQKVTKKNLKVDKKRKRVLHVSDSESDNETNDPFVSEKQKDLNSESEDEIPPTPSVNTFKITSGIVNPKKRRKIVDKTYTDEDGYILTKKEEVYESCSENDEEVISKENVNKIKVETSPKEKKNAIKNSKKKVSPPQSGKQASLMNYFKKVNQ